MSANKRRAAISIAALLCLTAPAGAQTLFTTQDYKQDRARWGDPAYYGYNTFTQLREMQERARFGQEGNARQQTLDLASPYPFKTAEEHFEAWRAAAKGGTKHTFATMPNWAGRWTGGNAPGLRNGDNPASATIAMLTPTHQEHYVQALKAAAEGRDWWPGAFCLPTGYISSLTSTDEFIVHPNRVWILGSSNNRNYIRWIYIDGEHVGGGYDFGKWQGESIGFWDGDSLVIHTSQLHGWKSALFEYSDNMTAVERYRRVGDQMQGEITLYDPEVFVRPFHSKITYRLDREETPEGRPLFNTCTDTNGPSSKVFMNDEGRIDERLPGDPLYWDPTDTRPWATFFGISEDRHRRARGAARQ